MGRITDKPEIVLVDELIGLASGSLGRLPVASLAARLVIGGAVAEALGEKADGQSVANLTDQLVTERGRIDALVPLQDGLQPKGDWDASSGAFPSSSTVKGYWIVSGAGTVGGVEFSEGDRLIALIANASTSVYAGNWLRSPALADTITVDRVTVSGKLSVAGVPINGATTRSPNIFDDLDPDVTPGHRLASDGLSLLENASVTTTGWIPVTEGQSYTFPSRHTTGWYGTRDLASAISVDAASSANTLTAPSGAAWMRTGYESSLEDYWIVEGATALSEFMPYGALLNTARLFAVPGAALADKAVTPEKTAFAARGKNHFDASTVSAGYMNTAGSVSAGSFVYSSPIAVEPGQTWYGASSRNGAGFRFLTAFDAGGAPVSASGVANTANSYTVPPGIFSVVLSIPSDRHVGFQFELGTSGTAWEPYHAAATSDLRIRPENLIGSLREPVIGQHHLRRTRMALNALALGDAVRLSVGIQGDSWTHSEARYSGAVAEALIAMYGDGGGGWTGYAFYTSGTLPYGPGNQPGLINGNVREDRYTLNYSGSWVCTYFGTASPDMGVITSSTPGDRVTRTVPATPDHTALREVFLGTSDGVVRYRVDGGPWSANTNVQGGVDVIGTFDITLSGGAHTIDIEVVSGTVTLCGDIALSTSPGVVVHKLAASGSRLDHWTGADATQQTAAWALLGLQSLIVMDGTNSQTQGTTPTNWATGLQTIIDRHRAATPMPDILIAVPSENGRLDNRVPMGAYAEAARTLARINRTAYLDLQSFFGDQPLDYMGGASLSLFKVGDTLHPEATRGGRIMVGAFLTAIGAPPITRNLRAAIIAQVPQTVAALPRPGRAGRRAFVTDASAPTYGAPVAGGGTTATPVYDDGTAWRVG